MMIYAVVDTNVLVSALWTKNDQAATFRVVKLLQEGKFVALYNEEILAEYEEVLLRISAFANEPLDWEKTQIFFDEVEEAMKEMGI